MPTLKIDRESQWYSSVRDFNIYVDHKKIGEVGNGDTKEFEISEGTHTLYAKIDWFESRTIQIKAKDGLPQIVHLKSARFSISKFPLLFITPFLVYKTDLEIVYLALLFIPFILFLIYTMTFGKRSLLILEN